MKLNDEDHEDEEKNPNVLATQCVAGGNDRDQSVVQSPMKSKKRMNPNDSASGSERYVTPKKKKQRLLYRVISSPVSAPNFQIDAEVDEIPSDGPFMDIPKGATFNYNPVKRIIGKH